VFQVSELLSTATRVHKFAVYLVPDTSLVRHTFASFYQLVSHCLFTDFRAIGFDCLS